MDGTRAAAIVIAGLVLSMGEVAEARPERCQKVLIDAGRKYVAMIYATEHRDCSYEQGAHCDKRKRRDHYVSLRGGKVPRKCSDGDVELLATSGLLDWQLCAGTMDREGLGQCFLDYFEARAEAWVELIYESGESAVCKERLFEATKRFLRSVGRDEMRCRARQLRLGELGSCAEDPQVARNVERQERRLRNRACGADALVDAVIGLALSVSRDTLGFADARYSF